MFFCPGQTVECLSPVGLNGAFKIASNGNLQEESGDFSAP
jgi:hypothetical protein